MRPVEAELRRMATREGVDRGEVTAVLDRLVLPDPDRALFRETAGLRVMAPA